MADTTRVVKVNPIEELSIQFSTAVQDIDSSLSNVEKNLGLIDGNSDLWSGKVARTFHDMYSNSSSDFDDINKKLSDFSESLKKIAADYKRAMEKSKKSIDDMEESLKA